MEVQSKVAKATASMNNGSVQPPTSAGADGKATGLAVVVAQPVQMGGPITIGGGGRPGMGGFAFGRFPQRIVCRFCSHDVITIVQPYVGTGTHLYALLCCCACICLGPLPYICNDCKDVKHICPNCHHVVGVDRVL